MPVPLTSQSDGLKCRVLLISQDVLGGKMAGPGIRYYHLSRVLSRYTSLTLAILPQDDQSCAELQGLLPDVAVIEYTRESWNSLRHAAQDAEIIILSPFTAHQLPELTTLPAALVMDGYDPLLIEWLTMLPEKELPHHMGEWSKRMTALFFQYLCGDFFICATERQRYWWLGQLEVAGRINPLTYEQDPSLRSLVDVVAYGLPEAPAHHSRPVVKGVWPGIGPEDVVILWGGGLWPWLDPVTAVHAIARLHPTHPHLKLIFPGTIHPNPDVQAMPVHNTRVYTFAAEQGLLNQAIFFGEWVPYADWPNILLESDIALSLHHDTAETQLAYRSRMLEYIWGGVPIIATRGDATSELIGQYNLGKVVDYHDVDGVAAAILAVLNEPPTQYQSHLAQAREALSWERTAEPLIRFCQNPRRAADRQTAVPGGVPYYELLLAQSRAEIARLAPSEAEAARLAQLVSAYENGKFMRLMRAFQQWRRGFAQ